MSDSIATRGTHTVFNRPVVALHGWGMSAEDVALLVRQLAEEVPAFDWHADTDAPRGALSLHLVDFAALTGKGRAAWNAFGPIEAMRQAREQGVAALALCRGRVSQLPAVRKGVWVMAADKPWACAVQTSVRALAALEWTRAEGYKAVPAWRAARKFADANLLAVLGFEETAAGFSEVLREALTALLMQPAALAVAGVPEHEVQRTIIEAGLHELQPLVAAPMTLDGAMRVDALLGFPWPALD
ncbi:Uncharacterised protein [Achromobacter spanius]|uniref:hypothetical protein n=1 Tax=Achromobacter spanius TaxID=217203 RepID=UPI000F6C6629|nr:hypothetical protein [Achromobacter spanius]CAB3666186.1 hypothetical protein LMG5911_03229 [Achromobacter spanius]VEE57104.1 Uncharacterised protein [Achromobacter spanius]